MLSKPFRQLRTYSNPMKMNTKTFTVMVVVSALLISTLFTAQQVNSQLQRAQITILADGSIIGTDKIHQNGNTYTLIENLNASIIIEKDNIVL
jgi:methylthioribose-1-phosphate isomerase